MRHYCPDVPICLTVDGNFDVSDLQNDYNLIVLRVSELPSTEMRELMWGNSCRKAGRALGRSFGVLCLVRFRGDSLGWFSLKGPTGPGFQYFLDGISYPA